MWPLRKKGERVQSQEKALIKKSTVFLKRLYQSAHWIIILMMVITLSTAFISYASFNDLQKKWQQEYQRYVYEEQLYYRLYREIGYLGYIHNFKNIVIRKQPNLVNTLEEQYQKISTTLNALQELHKTVAKQELIRNIEKTFENYHKNVPALKQSIQKNWSVEKTDAIVKVDDSNALESLGKLVNTSAKQFQSFTLEINETLDQIKRQLLMSLLLTAFFAATILYLLRRKYALTHNISNLQEQSHSLEMYYEGILNSLSDSCIITDKKGVIEHYNPKTTEIFDYDPLELIGKNVSLLIPEGEYKSNHANYMKSPSMQKNVLSKDRALHALRKDGSIFPAEVTITPFKIRDQLKFVGVIHDITERTALMEQLATAIKQLETDAHHDHLTSLANRKAFYLHAEKAWSKAIRKHSAISILMIDLDYFKRINDQFGHNAGDHVLVQCSKLFIEHCRKEDFICRWGGEEFLILLEDENPKNVLEFANRLKEQTERLEIVFEDTPIPVTLSIGISTTNQAEKLKLDQLISQSDEALYKAKENGRNRVECV